MGIRRIETISHEFVEQLRQLLSDSYPQEFGFKVDYFIGEDNGVRGIYISVSAAKVGAIYKSRVEMKPHETTYDVEEQFIGNVVNDFVLTGLGFLFKEFHNDKMIRDKKDEPALIDFRTMGRKFPVVIHMN